MQNLNNIQYIQIYSDNIDDFYEIWLESIKAVNPNFINSSVLDLKNSLTDSKKAMLYGEYSGFAIVKDNRVVGIARYKILLDEMYLDSIYVKQEHRNMGIASNAIDYLIFNEPSAEYIITIPMFDNSLFIKKGFKESNLYNNKFEKYVYELFNFRSKGHFDVDYSDVKNSKKAINILLNRLLTNQVEISITNEKNPILLLMLEEKRHWRFSRSINYLIQIIEQNNYVNPRVIHMLVLNLIALGIFGRALKLLNVFCEKMEDKFGEIDNVLLDDRDVLVFSLQMYINNQEKVLYRLITTASNNKYSSPRISLNQIKRLYEEYSLHKHIYMQYSFDELKERYNII